MMMIYLRVIYSASFLILKSSLLRKISFQLFGTLPTYNLFWLLFPSLPQVLNFSKGHLILTYSFLDFDDRLEEMQGAFLNFLECRTCEEERLREMERNVTSRLLSIFDSFRE